MIRHATIAATMAVLGLGGGAEAQAADTAARAKLRANCRLAHQVLTKDQPATKTEWAIQKISSCPELGGEAIAAALERRSEATSRSEVLEQLVLTADQLIDQRIFRAALKIARDPAAGEVARIQALRVAHFQLDPFIRFAPFEAYVRSDEPLRGVFFTPTSSQATVGRPLAEDARGSALSVLDELQTDPSTPERVRTAAENIAATIRPVGGR